jgi:hypothetical protein
MIRAKKEKTGMKEIIIALGFCLAVLPPFQTLSDSEIKQAIEAGQKAKAKDIWKSVEKNRTVKIHAIGDTVAKRVCFLTDADAIALASSDATRRHQVLTIEKVREWPDLGSIHALLIAQTSGIYVMNLPKWQAPAVHMIITADGREIQPESEGATKSEETKILPTEHGIVTNSAGVTSYTPLYQTAAYDLAKSNTWFAFKLPKGARTLRVTVISADGHEHHEDFDPKILRAQP